MKGLAEAQKQIRREIEASNQEFDDRALDRLHEWNRAYCHIKGITGEYEKKTNIKSETN